jgi:hypothetical protein
MDADREITTTNATHEHLVGGQSLKITELHPLPPAVEGRDGLTE